jgi:hypothetical protein
LIPESDNADSEHSHFMRKCPVFSCIACHQEERGRIKQEYEKEDIVNAAISGNKTCLVNKMLSIKMNEAKTSMKRYFTILMRAWTCWMAKPHISIPVTLKRYRVSSKPSG